MGKSKHIAIYVYFLTHIYVKADSYSVQVGTEEYVNVVDSRFLSFTIDPKYLFTSSEKYNSKECICMATSLSPAFLRIAGPSTAHLVFRNTSITIGDAEHPKLTLSTLFSDEDDLPKRKSKLSVTHSQWEKFVHWAKGAGFDLVLALNSDEKTSSGMWDPNSALKVLSLADEAKLGDIYWQLGYECANQSIEEYLNDLETLRVITETFPSGQAGGWRVVGGDVSHCLQADSKSDFKDYVTLSNDMMDAVLLNGNSTSQELERMSERDRYKLLKFLSTSDTPLWLTEHSLMSSELDRAADWMTSLGYSARNGFSVHYRELMEKELYEPSLSFYMALLYKNLVGHKVLNVDIEASQAILFAHCTSLRHKPVPGAVTFYGANMDEEPARFSIKMSKKEDGGDVMQFILGHDRNGNIVVNGRPMYYEGDIRPVVKRVRPYKTLFVNLPAKSFGFWVLANTQVQACSDEGNNINKDKLANNISENSNDNEKENNLIKSKRSAKRKTRDIHNLGDSEESILGNEDNELEEDNKALKERVENINNDFKNARRIFFLNTNKTSLKRDKRQTLKGENENKIKHVRSKLRNSLDNISEYSIFNRLSKLSKEQISRLKQGKLKRIRGFKRNFRVKSKRHSKDEPFIKPKTSRKEIKVESNEMRLKDIKTKKEASVRKRRSVEPKNREKHEEESSENEIDVDDKDNFKIGKILHKLKKLSELPLEIEEKDVNNDYEEQDSTEGIVLKTKVLDNSAVIDISEKSHTGLLKSTLQDILSLLADFNKNINRFWAAVTILE